MERGGDIFDELSDLSRTLAPARPKAEAQPLNLSCDEAAVLKAVGDDPAHIDAITDACGLPPPQVASLLMLLELRKAVTQLPGKHFVRKAELAD